MHLRSLRLPLIPPPSMRLILGLILGLGLLASSRAQVILPVDVSNPGMVAFIATGAAPGADSTMNSADGFTLLGFLTSPNSSTSAGISKGLKAPGMSTGYFNFFALDYGAGTYEAGVDANLFGDDQPQVFSTAAPAFTGTTTFDLTAIIALLPAVGHTGDIRAGDALSTGPVIGQYQVVPEPASAILATFAGGTLLFFRRRR